MVSEVYLTAMINPIVIENWIAEATLLTCFSLVNGQDKGTNETKVKMEGEGTSLCLCPFFTKGIRQLNIFLLYI